MAREKITVIYEWPPRGVREYIFKEELTDKPGGERRNRFWPASQASETYYSMKSDIPMVGAEHTIGFRVRLLLNSKEVYPFGAAVVSAEGLVTTAQSVAIQFGRCETCAELVEKAKGPVCGYGLSSKGESLDAEGARTRVHAPKLSAD